MVKVTRTSILSGITRTLDIPDLDEITLLRVENRNALGIPIQELVPFLTDDEREFLMTGITAQEWNTAFGKEDD